MRVILEVRTVGGLRDLESYFYNLGDNENCDRIAEAIKAQKALDVEELNKEGATPEERIENLLKKGR